MTRYPDNNTAHGFGWWLWRISLLALVVAALICGFSWLFASTIGLLPFILLWLGLILLLELYVYLSSPIIVTFILLLLPIAVIIFIILALTF
ncbi:hypothetical protein ACNAN0_00240 [Agrilactobacillus fermenti]|uniref:hypothetical protein n=1 Tax=Agrilactobacillus fermenti TaxID=2586909 RepID=UPI001E45F440|nr:hypothetical protein [Agrilactobacillus fermenti]MCD2256145.1 hypothetical protein [Agrilactobacillus fermenti]